MSTNVDVAFDAYILFTLLTVASIGSMYLAGRIAERRGRCFKIWAWIAAMIGPLALPLIFLFPNLHRKNAGHG
jgi:MFS family permease